MKILYIEDELKKQKNKIDFLFSSLMSRKMKNDFNKLILDNDADSEDFRDLINKSGIIDIAITFAEALDKIINHKDEYALFIVDRNLSENTIYDFEQINKIHADYFQEYYDKFFEREGDYILQYLISKGVDCSERFYMLTANKDQLRNEEFVKEKIHFKQFQYENIIIKNDIGDEERLKDTIGCHREIMIRFEHPEIFLLEKVSKIRKKHAELLADILLDLKEKPNMNQVAIAKNLESLRGVVVGLLNDINDIDELRYYVKDERNRNTKEGTKIEWLKGKKSEFLQPYFRYVYDITSGLVLHEEQKSEDRNPEFPTINTLNSAISAMKDIFKWISLNIEQP
jgi:hypothetical protein